MLIILLLLKKLKGIIKLLNLKLKNRVRINKHENIFSKCFTEYWSREIFVIDSVLKTNSWTNKIKNLN